MTDKEEKKKERDEEDEEEDDDGDDGEEDEEEEEDAEEEDEEEEDEEDGGDESKCCWRSVAPGRVSCQPLPRHPLSSSCHPRCQPLRILHPVPSRPARPCPHACLAGPRA